jgi:hypothetical protein
VQHHVIPWSETPVLYNRARALPVQRGPHAGPIASAVARATGHEVRPVPIREASSPHASGGGGGVWYYRPRSAPMTVPGGGAAPRPHAQANKPHSNGAAPQVAPAPQAAPAPHAKPQGKEESGSEHNKGPHAR